jgi:hypothetical protein
VRVDVENVSNGSTVEALWALGALEPKKRLKRPDGGLGVMVPKTAPPKAPFSATFSRDMTRMLLQHSHRMEVRSV